jgi:hypothetical protein
MKCLIIPVIIRATGIVTKGLKKYQETISGKHSIDSLKKEEQERERERERELY